MYLIIASDYPSELILGRLKKHLAKLYGTGDTEESIKKIHILTLIFYILFGRVVVITRSKNALSRLLDKDRGDNAFLLRGNTNAVTTRGKGFSLH